MHDIHVARQPIFDVQDRLYGYEILYRSRADQNFASGVSHEQMATDTLVHTLLGMGLDHVTHGTMAFFNISQDVLLANPIEVLDPSRVVIEILETVACNPATLDVVRRLRAQGFTIALDDFVLSPALEPFVRLAQIIKVDVLDRDPVELQRAVDELRPYGCRLLAEKVESAEEHARFREMGFDLFQGYFYARPEILSKREIPVAHVNALRLMNTLRDPDSSDNDVETAFRHDLPLTYKLLRIVNSAAVGGRGIESIGHAIRLIGREALYRWLALLVISSMVTRSGISSELVQAAVMRGRLCELIAQAAGSRDAGQLFMVGLFSHLDALLRRPMDEILDHVDLAPTVREALLARGGPLATALLLVEAYETARWNDVAEHATALGICHDELPALYRAATEWTRERVATIAA